MRTRAALLLCLLMTSAPALADWLAEQRWQQRLVVVQGLTPKAMEAVLAEHGAALRERRLAVWLLQDEQLLWLGGAEPASGKRMADAGLETLRAALRRAPAEAGLHLFGLDGGLKASRGQPAGLKDLIEAVDSMPMRVREMRG